MATKTQIQMIHIARQKVGMNEDNYRACLASFNVRSSTELTSYQAKELLSRFVSMGFNIISKAKYNTLTDGRRGSDRADASKLRLIEVLWRQKSRLKTDESLAKMIKRIVKVDNIAWLTKSQANKVIKAINSI